MKWLRRILEASFRAAVRAALDAAISEKKKAARAEIGAYIEDPRLRQHVSDVVCEVIDELELDVRVRLGL